jgi:hypothetical protein
MEESPKNLTAEIVMQSGLRQQQAERIRILKRRAAFSNFVLFSAAACFSAFLVGTGNPFAKGTNHLVGAVPVLLAIPAIMVALNRKRSVASELAALSSRSAT